ncbi:TRAP transporter small permease [Rhizobium daejeonense]|uniref:TRAP transporter small permease protein n=1 Tax=Rhizobium daejeonense TaxID=240521 RepID=A0A6M1S2M5_9HYPH|nr:TRAP transporter small permease [Rhizobium daejeonense]NGO65325.1 TRAP transporter small permease [Rhizobium daejeonense]
MWKVLDRAEEFLAIVFLTGTVLAVLLGAIGRAIGQPFPSGPEIAQLLLIWSCMFGADLIMKRGEHIRISALPDALSTNGRRALNFLCLVCMILFLTYTGWLGWHLAMSNWAREIGASGLSYGWVTLAFPVGCVLMIISLLRRTFGHGLIFSIEPEHHDREQLL